MLNKQTYESYMKEFRENDTSLARLEEIASKKLPEVGSLKHSMEGSSSQEIRAARDLVQEKYTDQRETVESAKEILKETYSEQNKQHLYKRAFRSIIVENVDNFDKHFNISGEY